jgi:hypothetical protein
MLSRYACLFMLAATPFSNVRAQTSSKAVEVSHCILHKNANSFAGSCGPLFDQTPGLMLHPVAALSSGLWRKDKKPLEVFSGDMTDDGHPNELLELEVYAGGVGNLRTEYGWFPIHGFVANASLTFLLDPTQQVAPGPLDLAIVRRAAAILSSESSWNRADNRQCPEYASKWSIYCALEKAEIELAGGFHHRRPAAEVVRELVDQRTANREYHHRLMEYNNDPTTHLEDIQSLFKEAETKILDAQSRTASRGDRG